MLTALGPKESLALFNTLSHEQQLKIMVCITRPQRVLACPRHWPLAHKVGVADICAGKNPNAQADERTRIGNYPTCDECGEQHSQDVACEDVTERRMRKEQKQESRLDQQDVAERECAKCGGEFEAPIHSVAKNSHQFIDITPVGCSTPEGQSRVQIAHQEWDDATHALANYLKNVVDDIFYTDGDKIARAA